MQNHTTRDSTNEIKYCQCGCGKPRSNPNRRYLRGHSPKYKGPSPEERFWEKVDKRGPDECWFFTGALRNGYGCVRIDDELFYAHRFSYELHNGPIPDGLLVCHSCDDAYPIDDISYRACCNPAHLYTGSHSDNNQDAYDKGRANITAKVRNNSRKLTASDVRQIRHLHANGILYPAIAEQFDISIPMVSLIIQRKRWSNVR